MRLRQTIRAPSRYEDECELLAGVSPRRLPRRKKAAAAAEEERALPPYVEYDPNHPPAAFPTLDHPLPAGQTYHSLTTTTSPSDAAAANANPPTDDADLEADGHHLDAFDSLYRGIPPQQLDNFIASNGPQNPQYKRNMALLAREDDSSNLDISDDDDAQQRPDNEATGAQWIPREEPIPDDPQWSDISLSLQIEIAENMLETHRLSTIQLLLGLSQSDTEQLTRNLHMQNKDLEYENRVLDEMRNKQMEALMCLDNSDLNQHSVPARLVMSRKVWDQCHRVIRKQSKMKYLLCQAGDLLLARKFLSKRGLPMTYAGEWDNQFVATPSISSTGGTADTLKWKSTTEPQSDASTAAENTYLLPANSLHSATTARTSVQNPSPATLNDMPVAHLPSTRPYEPLPRASTYQSSIDRHVQLALPNQALVRLRIGPKNAARIHIDQPATPSRRHMESLLATPQTQAREPNSDDTIEETPSELDRFDGMHHQYSMPVRRMFGSWSTGTSRLQPPEPSFSIRQPPGSFNNVALSLPSTVKPQARQFDQVKRRNTHNQFTLDTAHSFDSSPPQPSDLSAMEGVVYGNSRDLTVRNAMQTPASSSPNYTTTTKLTADDNHIQLPKTNVENSLATPESYRTAVGERQLQSSISAYQRSSMSPSNDADFGNLGSTSASYSQPGTMVDHIELKQNERGAQADTDIFSPFKAMQGLNLLPSISLDSIETAKGQADDVGSFEGRQAQPGISPNRLPDEAPQGVNSFTTPQPTKSSKRTNPLFGFDSLEIHTDNQQASRAANTGQSNQSYPSTGQGQPAADTVDTSKGDSSLMADMSGAEVRELPSIDQNNNAKPEAAKTGPGEHLSPISANVAADVPSTTRKTRQSSRKQTTGTKRDASTEMKAAQPKRGKHSSPTPTPTTNPTTNATSTPNTKPPVTRGRGRPRKYPIQ